MVPAEDAARMTGKVVQQLELLGRQGDLPALHRDQHSGWIDGQVVEDERGLGFRLAFVHPPQNRPHPADELLRTEGFDDIVIGAQLESGDAVALLSSGGDDDDGSIASVSNPSPY